MRPKWVDGGPILHTRRLSASCRTLLLARDGGPFITLPQVYTEDADRPGWRHSNLGMYRVQLAGNEYRARSPSRAALSNSSRHRRTPCGGLAERVPFRVNIFVGGPPAMTLAAVMPLPEGLPELAFAGVLGGRRVRLTSPRPPAAEVPRWIAAASPAEADFCITGTVDPNCSCRRGRSATISAITVWPMFPGAERGEVWHREAAIWPFTVVGRPPQEDTSFGQIIHELTGPIIPTVVHGVHAVHAVDAAGVILCSWPSAANVTSPTPATPAAGTAHLGQRHSRPRAVFAGEISAHCGEGGRSASWTSTISRRFFQHLLDRVDWRTDCISKPARRSTRSITAAAG